MVFITASDYSILKYTISGNTVIIRFIICGIIITVCDNVSK